MKKWLLLLLLMPVVCVSQHKTDTLALYFKNDIHDLSKAQTVTIDSINNLTSIKSIKIDGYANSYASEAYNQALSMRRAMSVKSILEVEALVEIKSHGEVNSTSAKERRVDVIIISELPPVKLKEKHIDIQFANKKVGDKIILDGILFYPGVDVIREESKDELNNLLQFTQDYPDIKFKIIGHVCCGYNNIPSSIDGTNNRTGQRNLSSARAEAIYTFLVENGVSSYRMAFKGMAFLEPRGKGENADRRVEIEIVE